jgi:Na+/phosphate symporter
LNNYSIFRTDWVKRTDPQDARTCKRLDSESLKFSEDGQKEIFDFQDRVLANVQLALQVIVTRSPGGARQLVSEKEDIEASNKNCSPSIWGNCAMD